jgi:hypothetical protein
MFFRCGLIGLAVTASAFLLANLLLQTYFWKDA